MATTLQPAEIQAPTQAAAAQLQAMLHAAGVAPIADRVFLRITGSDAARWLNGMVTNNIAALAPGQGCYNFLLNSQGRILGDCTIYRDPAAGQPAFLLQTDASQAGAIQHHLDKYIIMDDVELAPAPDQPTGILIAGPDALRAVSELGGTPCATPTPPPPDPAALLLKHTVYRGAPVVLIKADSPLVPRFELWADSATIAQISAELASIPPVAPEALEALRILSGTPRYATDIRNTETAHDLPQETAQPHALHFAKGCYLGQEIVERIRSRGKVHRTFTGFSLTGHLPVPGTALSADSKPVGELTSVAHIFLPSGALQLALGYIRREALDRKLPLEYPGGTATATELPFSRVLHAG
jgi:folate-binding protein YgfZ